MTNPLVMGRTPFYRTSIELEHHFSNIERTRTCSSIGDRTRKPYFWLRTNEHWTSNLIGLSSKLLIELTPTSFFEHQTNSNMFIYWWSNSKIPEFWLWMNKHRTLILVGISIDLLNYLSNIIFLNIESTWTCSTIGNQTRTPYFWLRTIQHRILNTVRPITTC